jgi:hypothetical protein
MAIKTPVSISLPLVLRLSRRNSAAAFTALFAAPLRITNNHSLPVPVKSAFLPRLIHMRDWQKCGSVSTQHLGRFAYAFGIVLTLRTLAQKAHIALSNPEPRVAVHVISGQLRLLLSICGLTPVFVIAAHALLRTAPATVQLNF